MTTTPHDKAIQAAANGIQWTQDCTFETIAENVVRDYFSSIGGIVVPREPTPAMISAYCELQNGLGINAFANGRLAWEAMINASPLHAPIEAGNGADGWMDIASAPKDGSDILVFCGDTEEQFVAWWGKMREGFIFATTHTGRPIVCIPTHWRPLPPPPSPSNEGEKQS